MKPVPQQLARLFGILFLAGVMALLVLVHVTSNQQQRCCEKESFDISLIKLI